MHQGPQRALKPRHESRRDVRTGGCRSGGVAVEALKWTDEDEMALQRVLQMQRR